MTGGDTCGIIRGKVNSGFSARALQRSRENRESGENPERYRHCKRGGAILGESRSLSVWMRRLYGAADPQVRIPAEMRLSVRLCKYGVLTAFAQKSGCRSVSLRQLLFSVRRCPLALPIALRKRRRSAVITPGRNASPRGDLLPIYRLIR